MPVIASRFPIFLVITAAFIVLGCILQSNLFNYRQCREILMPLMTQARWGKKQIYVKEPA
jgi:hypothetical protein